MPYTIWFIIGIELIVITIGIVNAGSTYVFATQHNVRNIEGITLRNVFSFYSESMWAVFTCTIANVVVSIRTFKAESFCRVISRRYLRAYNLSIAIKIYITK